MRAWLLDDIKGPASLRLGEVEDPSPAGDEVVVDLKVAGLNHLECCHVWLAGPEFLSHILGADCAGVVAVVGEAVRIVCAVDEVISILRFRCPVRCLPAG